MRTRTRNRTIGALAALALAIPLATAGFAQSTDVAVVDNSFDPASLTVTAGETVTWTSSGSNPHTVTADDGSFDSSPDCNGFADSAGGACMDSGETYAFTFDEPGTYPYHCKLHGSAGGNGMAGTIVVEAASSTTDGGTTDGGTTDGATTDGSAEEEPTVAETLPMTGPVGGGAIALAAAVVVGGGVLLLSRRPQADP